MSGMRGDEDEQPANKSAFEWCKVSFPVTRQQSSRETYIVV